MIITTIIPSHPKRLSHPSLQQVSSHAWLLRPLASWYCSMISLLISSLYSSFIKYVLHTTKLFHSLFTFSYTFSQLDQAQHYATTRSNTQEHATTDKHEAMLIHSIQIRITSLMATFTLVYVSACAALLMVPSLPSIYYLSLYSPSASISKISLFSTTNNSIN